MHSAVDVSDITVCVCVKGPAAQVLQEYPLTNYRFQGWVEAAVFRYYFFAWPMQTMLALASRGNPGGRLYRAASAHIDSCSAADAAGYALSLGVTHSSADQHEAQMGLHARTRAHACTL